MNMKRLILFFVFTYLFTWFIWGFSLLDAQEAITLPFNRGYLGIVGGFGPSTVGMIYLIKYKGESFKTIIKRTFILPWNKSNYFMAFLILPFLFFTAFLVTSVFFDVTYALEAFDAPYLIPVIYFYILFLGGPLGEEIGWRGYALPELMRKYSPFIASIVLGVIWSLWHLPAFFIPGSSQAPIPFLPYVINTTMLSVLFTILYLKTKRRISSALYFHASVNFGVGLLYVIEEMEGIILYLILFTSVFAYLVYKNRAMLFTSEKNKT